MTDSDLPTLVPKLLRSDILPSRRADSFSMSSTSMSSNLKSNMNTISKEEDLDSTKGRSCRDKPNKTKLSKNGKSKPNVEDLLGTASSLDQTSDFAGGFTPYKALAEKRPLRTRRQEVTINRSQRLSKLDNQPGDKPLRSLNKGQIISRSKASEGKQRVQENFVLTNLALNQVNQIDGLHTVDDRRTKIDECRDNSTLDKAVDEKPCNICERKILPGDTDHLSTCLQSHFKFKSISHKMDTYNAENKEAELRQYTGTECVFCQVCQEDITPLSDCGRTDHVNACVDGSATADVTPLTSCHICTRDLTQLNPRRRLQHVNFCADKAKNQSKEQEVTLKNAQQKVLDCPLCGKPLQTLLSRRNHLKQCARSLGVGPGLLKQRINQQVEEHSLQLAAGVLPPPTKVTRPRKPRRRAAPNNSNGGSVPGRHMDADTELAIALSTSLAEQQRLEAGLAGGSTKIEDECREETNAFQVLMTPKPTKTSKRGRKNKGPDRVPQLLLQSQEELQRHLASRMELLFSQLSYTKSILSTPPIGNVTAHKRSRGILTEGTYKIAEESPWWTLTKLMKYERGQELECVADKENINDVFFVQQLMPPVTLCAAQGKPQVLPTPTTDYSITTQSRCETASHPNIQPDAGTSSVLSPNETLVATTQTAAYLAELAAESGNSTLNWTLHGSTLQETGTADSEPTPIGVDSRGYSMSTTSPDACAASAHETSGFVMSNTGTDRPQIGHDETSCLLEQLRGMVNNPVMSDFQIKVRDGSVFGHKFMIAARCPHLLKDLKNTSTISLTEYDSNTVIAVLTYIYTGVIHNTSAQVAKVAAQWNIVGLLRLLNQSPEDTSHDIAEQETSQSNLDDILKHIWGSDYEDSDSDGESSQVVEPNEEDMDNACTYVLTQHRMKERRDQTGEAATESEEEPEDKVDCTFNHHNRTAADVLNELAKLDQQSLESSGDEHLPDSAQSESESYEGLDADAGTDLTIPQPENKNMPQSLQVYRSDSNVKRVTVDIDHGDVEVTYTEQLEETPLLLRDKTSTVVSTQSDISNGHQETAGELNQGHNECAVNGRGEAMSTRTTKLVEVGAALVDEVLADEVDVLDLTLGPDDVDSDNALYKIEESPIQHESKTFQETAATIAKTPKGHGWNVSELSTPELFAGSPQTPCSVDEEGVLEGPNRTPKSDTSDLDLFEVDSSISDEDLVPMVVLSPVFKSTILNEPNDSFTEDYLDTKRNINNKNTNDGIHQSRFKCSLNKRKRLPSVSSEEETSLSQKKKKSRFGSVTTQHGEGPSSQFLEEPGVDGAPEDGHCRTGPSDEHTRCASDNYTRGASDEQSRVASDGHTRGASDDRTGGAHDVYTRGAHEDHTGGAHDDHTGGAHDDHTGGAHDDHTGGAHDDHTGGASDDYTRGARDDQTGGAHDDHTIGPSDNCTTYSSTVSDDARAPSSDQMIGPSDDYGPRSSVLPTGSSQTSPSTNRDKEGGPHAISRDSDLDIIPLQSAGHDCPEADHDSAEGGSPHTALIDLTQGEVDWAVTSGAHPDANCVTDHNVSLANSTSPNYVPEEEHWSGADVWSDFDDGGYTEDFLLPYTQGSQKSADGQMQSPQHKRGSSTLVQEADFEYDPPTDVESDVSMLEEGSSTSPSVPKDNYVTPKPPKAQHRHLSAKVPSPFTPMADYENMVTPDVKKACLKYGVRAMPKKRMVKLLKSIYESTHQYETDSELEQSFETTQSSTIKESDETTTKLDMLPPEMTAVKGTVSSTQHANTLRHSERTRQSDDETETANRHTKSPLPIYVNNAEDSDDIPEESFLGTQVESASPSDKRTKDKLSSTEVKREKIRSDIVGDDNLYLKILHYEPLEFDAYRQQLKERGATVGSQILMDFLDEQNIQFTMRKSKEEKEKRREKTSRRGGRGSGRGRGRGPQQPVCD